MKFQVAYIETMRIVQEIEAETEQEAKDLMMERVATGRIDMSYGDLVENHTEILKEGE